MGDRWYMLLCHSHLHYPNNIFQSSVPASSSASSLRRRRRCTSCAQQHALSSASSGRPWRSGSWPGKPAWWVSWRSSRTPGGRVALCPCKLRLRLLECRTEGQYIWLTYCSSNFTLPCCMCVCTTYHLEVQIPCKRTHAFL